VRLFFALWPPGDTAAALGRWAREVQRQAGGRATSEETIHLTLAFLGEAKPERAVRAARHVGGATFDLPVDTPKYWRHNRIVWAGPRETPPALLALAENLRMQLYREEFILERRPFAAHVTLLRKAEAPDPMPALPKVSWPNPEFVLVRSAPGGQGARYEVLERFPLGVMG
jgi:2'-5' RNA ligase